MYLLEYVCVSGFMQLCSMTQLFSDKYQSIKTTRAYVTLFQPQAPPIQLCLIPTTTDLYSGMLSFHM